MINLVEVFKESSLYDVLLNKMNFSDGSRNVVMFSNDVLKDDIFKFILSYFNYSNLYVMSGFNLKPYLNLVDNVYDMLKIELDCDITKGYLFEYYCNILDFCNFNVDFHMLSDLDKLKGMIIVSLLSDSRVLVFDDVYPNELMCRIDGLLDFIEGLGLFSNRVFIELKKQDTF